MTRRSAPTLAALAFLIPLSACSAADSDAPKRKDSAAATESGVNTTYDVEQPTYDADAIAKHGKVEVERATNLVIGAVETNAYRDDLLRTPYTDLSKGDFLQATRNMTPTCVKAFNDDLAKALKGDVEAQNDVWTFSFFGFTKIDDAAVQPGNGPLASNRRIHSVKTTLAPNNPNYLQVVSTASADIRGVKAGKDVTVPLSRTTTIWVIKDTHGNWKIDGWTGSIAVGKSVPVR